MEGKMRAACYEAFGDAGVIKTRELDMPGLKEAEVLVKVKAAAVNPVDAAVRKGLLKGLPVVFPAIPGWDMTGIIEERGFAARRFNTGDEVYAYARRPVVQWGTYAQYIVIPESYLAPRPQTLSWEETAGIPLAGLTAYQSLFTTGHLHSGQTVLILGASGGVGTLAIQLATAKGAEVIGVASEKNHAYMKELGAAHTIDYHNTDIGEAIKHYSPGGVDLIFDAAGGDTLKQSLPALKKNGTVVSIVDRGTEIDKSIHFHFVFTDPNATDLEQLRELADAGKIKVPVSEIYGLDEAAEAMRQIETHHTRGKMVIVPW